MIASIETWALEQPAVIEVSQRLNEAGLPWGYFSGVLAEAMGVRSTDDLDVLVSAEDFSAAATALGTQPEPIVKTVQDAAGGCFKFASKEALATVGGREVQVVCPAPMVGEDAVFELSMTPLAAANRLSCEADGATVYFAHPFDTLAAKAIMWRGVEQGKYDAADVAALRQHVLASDYARTRGQEIGLTTREWERLGYTMLVGAIQLA